MVLEDFFKEHNAAIHCVSEEQAKRVCNAFNELGKTWVTGKSYVKNTHWQVYGKNTVYLNTGCFDSIQGAEKENYKIYEYDDISFDDRKSLLEENKILKEAIRILVDNLSLENFTKKEQSAINVALNLVEEDD